MTFDLTQHALHAARYAVCLLSMFILLYVKIETFNYFYRFKTEDEALAIANMTSSGLAGKESVIYLCYCTLPFMLLSIH